MITCIAAMNRFGTLGLKGVMPWTCPEDLQHFKSYTMGKTLLMGRKTFEGLPKVLRGRDVRVVTRSDVYPDAIQDLKVYLESVQNGENEIVICGGGEIYREALKYADKLVLSYIKDNDVIGDTFFPSFAINEFEILSRDEKQSFMLITYGRIRK